MVSRMRLRVGGEAQRALLVVLACVVALAAFASALTIAALHDHDCIGDGCSTCIVLDMAQAMLGAAATPVAPPAASAAAVAAGVLALAAWVLARSARTPVSEKVLLLI